MSVLSKLIRRLTRPKSIVWGIRVPKTTKQRWCSLSTLMGIPTNRLIIFVLQDWVQQNSELLLDEQARNELAGKIANVYLRNELK